MELDLKNDELKTLSECMASLNRHGFTANFILEERGLKAAEGDKIYSPEQIHIVNFFRFEGESDPADMSILYAIRTDDGLQGTFVDAFGTYSSARVSEFFRQVHDINKKTHVHEVV